MNLSRNKNLVSAIVINWNGKKWLKKCLKNLSNQNYKKLEIIVVDNASTDGSVEFIKENFPKVKIVRLKKNYGFSVANNKGINISKGKYILLINNDTWIEDKFIEQLVEYYNCNNYGVISPVVREYDGNNTILMIPSIDLTGSPAYFFPLSRKDKLFYLSTCYFCTKDIYKKTGGFDNNHFAYYEDVDWFWRLNLLKIKFGYANNVFIYHAGAGSTGKGIKYKMFLWRNQNALQTLLKNYSLLSLALVLPIYFIQNLIEIIFFLLIGKFNIAYSYVEGWIFNIWHLKRTFIKRKWVQSHRKVSDWEIFKKMYWGPAKLKMLMHYKSDTKFAI